MLMKKIYITQFYRTTLKIPPSMPGDDGILRLAICSKADILCKDLEKNGGIPAKLYKNILTLEFADVR